MKKMCYNCAYRGGIIRFADGRRIPHCHCQHPNIPEDKWGWDTLKEAFETCENFEKRDKGD